MTTLTKLAAVRLQEAQILATECAGCGHTLKQHPLTMSAGSRCNHHTPMSMGRLSYCSCREFVDPESQLAFSGSGPESEPENA